MGFKRISGLYAALRIREFVERQIKLNQFHSLEYVTDSFVLL